MLELLRTPSIHSTVNWGHARPERPFQGHVLDKVVAIAEPAGSVIGSGKAPRAQTVGLLDPLKGVVGLRMT